ncbi:MAG: adenine deaminase [Piccolia ochrophora]|nr:MAG: adenine deaminase [Piccolia ochrophora]
MCKSPLHPLLLALPKIEHHLHIEGTLTPDLLTTLSKRNSIPLPTDPAYASPAALLNHYETFTSLSDFLTSYFTASRYLITSLDFYELTLTYILHAASQNVRHLELSFDPQAHTARGVTYETVRDGIVAACHEAETATAARSASTGGGGGGGGITTSIILCFLRDRAPHEALATLRAALPDFANRTLAGIGLDGAETGYPPELFADVYALAAEHGIRRTAHAGEEAGPASVRGALDALDVARIDHGVALREDGALRKRVAERGALVTLCPVSNVRLKCVRSVGELPVREFLKDGVRWSVNSDDPAFFGAGVQACWCAVQEAFELGVEEWRGVCEAGIEGSWCGEERKEEIKTEMEKAFREWGEGSGEGVKG